MKRSDFIALVVIALFVFGVIIWIATSSEEESNSSAENGQLSRPSFAQRVARRIDAIKSEVISELEKLQRTREMQAFVDRKVNSYFWFIKISLGVLLIGIFGLFAYNGLEIWAATLSAVGACSFIVPLLTYFFFTNVMDVKELVNWVTERIKKSVYKKYGYDQSMIAELEKNVAIKKGIMNGLQKELDGELK